MRIQFTVGYCLAALLAIWSAFGNNSEFLAYSIVTAVLLAVIHASDRYCHYHGTVLWGFNLWLVMHILGGLYVVDSHVLYSHVLIDIVEAPYSILKYDQIVHAYCYFIIALLVWHIIYKISKKHTPHYLMAFITVLAATGIGGLNEIIEFLATVFIDSVNVGGYENTALDIIANLAGALLAIPLFSKLNVD